MMSNNRETNTVQSEIFQTEDDYDSGESPNHVGEERLSGVLSRRFDHMQICKQLRIYKNMTWVFEFPTEKHVADYTTADHNPPTNRIIKKNVVSYFNFLDPANIFILRIPKKQPDGEKCLEIILKIDHSKCTTLDLVGLQVWRGALLLADFVVNNGEEMFHNKTVMELACGVGLTGITAAMYSRRVIFSDIDDILETVKKNISNNKEVITSETEVICLDFLNTMWSESVQSAVDDADIILAADVVYDDEVTEGFVKTLVKIYKHERKKTIFIALEKRYIFTIHDLDVVAPCYDYFLECMAEAELEYDLQWNIELLPTDFPKYFDYYERNDELIIWKITN